MELIDSHCHLDTDAFDEDREDCLQRAKEAGLSTIINIGATDAFEGARRTSQLIDKYEMIYGSIGLHPHDASHVKEIAQLETYFAHDKIRAVGETGLDFHYDFASKEDQYSAFEAQIDLAKKLKLPLIIHCREAEEECLEVLKRCDAQEVGGVFHCFSGTKEFAERIFDINFIISVPGIITFKKSHEARETLKKVPLEKVMLETDSPYLAPEPHRGKRCESAYVRLIAERLAEIRDCSLEEVAEKTTACAKNFYGLS